MRWHRTKFQHPAGGVSKSMSLRSPSSTHSVSGQAGPRKTLYPQTKQKRDLAEELGMFLLSVAEPSKIKSRATQRTGEAFQAEGKGGRWEEVRQGMRETQNPKSQHLLLVLGCPHNLENPPSRRHFLKPPPQSR